MAPTQPARSSRSAVSRPRSCNLSGMRSPFTCKPKSSITFLFSIIYVESIKAICQQRQFWQLKQLSCHSYGTVFFKASQCKPCGEIAAMGNGRVAESRWPLRPLWAPVGFGPTTTLVHCIQAESGVNSRLTKKSKTILVAEVAL